MPPRTLPSFVDTTPPKDAINVTETLAGRPAYKPRAGYYQADDVNGPQRPSAIGGIVDAMGMPDQRGSNMMGDPYSDQEIAAAVHAPLESRPGVPLAPLAKPKGPTVIESGAKPRLGIGSQDQQLLEALGPEYAAEGQRLLNAPGAGRQPITGRNETTGESFVMPIGNRVSRRTLEPAMMRIQSEIAQKKLNEQRDAGFGQQRALAQIPVTGAIDLAKTKGDIGMRSQESEQRYKAPEQAARVGQMNQQTQAGAAQEARTQQQFQQANNPDARRRAANDAAIRALTEAGVASTPDGQKVLAQLQQNGSVGSELGANAAGYANAAAAPSPDAQLQAVQEFTADPQVSRLLQSIQENRPGFFPSSRRDQKRSADKQALDSYVKRYAAAKRIDPADLMAQIQSQLVQ